MNLSQFLPALKIPIDGFFIADLCGFILALPISLFLAFWLSEVKNRMTVVIGAFAGALLGFLAVLGLVDTLIFDQPLPDATPAGTFFGSVLLCSVLAISAAIILDLIVARRTRRDYRRPSAVAHE
ncbi:MAG: PTS sucrose transporter subunit IIBC [Chloroflexi bacterium]|nr:MAG: PTS sucrose transporter subunit IIBC [Chloroflexota bacterium]